MKVYKRAIYHSDVIMSLIIVCIVGGLFYTGISSLKKGELASVQYTYTA